MAPAKVLTKTSTACDVVSATVVTVLVFTTVASAMARPSSPMDKVMENYGRVLALWQKGPQPRAFEVAPMLQDINPMEQIHPRQTVLHRCDDLACCAKMQNPHAYRCEPQVENVTLYFRATVVGTRQQRSIQHDFQNHTRCECVPKNEDR